MLTIEPHWFAKWLIRLLALDLCHEIPIANIERVTGMGKWFSYGKVELQFQTVEGKDRTLLLYMKNHRDFVEKATSAIQQ
jgi:hypothetical protein